ncbi:MAG: type I-F CRISPR-associated endonuclease Cas1f, partial [Rhodospirillales bacterium]|nr:type I-F CRISPR-associated endonuclease Cas1f [Rhodospirillales bacterium]
NEAVRMLREEGVCIGFSGSGGIPLLAAQDPYPDLLTPFDEYRDPRFLHKWIEIWRDESRRLAAAKYLFRARLACIEDFWASIEFGAGMPDPPSQRKLGPVLKSIDKAQNTGELLGVEGNLARELYHSLSRHFGFDGFERKPRGGEGLSDPNALLDHGNYLAYGLASVVLWCLGIPPALAVLHGKTRRGAMVFDLADVIKDALIMPMAFATAYNTRSGKTVSETDFRSGCLTIFDDAKALDILFSTLTEVIDEC